MFAGPTERSLPIIPRAREETDKMARRTLLQIVEEPLYVAAQWNGTADDLGEIVAVGFDLQPEEGSRTGNKPLIVHDPNQVGYEPINIRRGEWAVRDIVNGGHLKVFTDGEMMDLIALLTEEAPLIISRKTK